MKQIGFSLKTDDVQNFSKEIGLPFTCPVHGFFFGCLVKLTALSFLGGEDATMRKIISKKLPVFLSLIVLVLTLCTPATAADRTLVPGGYTVGIKLYAQGLLITEVQGDTPAERAGLRKGDRIVSAGGKTMDSAQTLLDTIQTAQPVVVRVERNGHEAEFLVTPEKTTSGYRLGVLVRDHIAGIGTVTYYDPANGQYGALGHGVSSLDGTQLLMLHTGFLVRASVGEVRRGTHGAPGELHGIFDVTDAIGTVEKNTPYGIFGTLSQVSAAQPVKIAPAESVHTGAAQILSNVEEDIVQSFSIQIDRVDTDAKNGRNLLITVTDEALLAKTGGIVQGMSGSPIMQDGKLIGAVTHVCVNL